MSELHLELVAKTCAVLSRDWDVEKTFEEVLALTVPLLGDWCVGECTLDTATTLIVRHEDPLLEGDLRAAAEDGYGVVDRTHEALSQKDSLVLRAEDPSAIERVARDAAHAEALRRVGAGRIVVVAVRAREEVFGTLSFGSKDPEVTDAVILAAREIAERIAYAIVTARLVRRLERLLSGRDEVLAVVTHDLRTPLSTIGFICAKMKMDATPEIASDVDRILLSTRRMERMIKDLVDYSEIAAGRLSISMGRYPLGELVEQATAIGHDRASGREITTRVDDGDLEVLCDRDRLLQVLGNLVSNAIRFTPKDGHVTVTASMLDDHASIEIADDGVGIAAEEMEFVFQPFGPRERKAGTGLGLGLYIARALTEAQGGWLRVRSEQGRGTVATVELARYVGPVRQEPTWPILLVDDDADQRTAVAELLALHGYSIEQAENGQQAIEYLASGRPRPSLVMLDLMMPKLDGWEVVRRMRADESLSDIPVVVLSAIERRRAMRTLPDVQDYLEKPAPLAKLISVVHAVAGPAPSEKERPAAR